MDLTLLSVLAAKIRLLKATSTAVSAFVNFQLLTDGVFSSFA
jgi:hypothetical protein